MIQNLHDRQVQTHTLLLVRNWLEEHDKAIRRECRSGKQYQQFIHDFITLLISDSNALHRLQEGQLEIWMKADRTLSTGRGSGLRRNNYDPPLEGQIDLVEAMRQGGWDERP